MMRDLIPARRTADLVVRESGDETLVAVARPQEEQSSLSATH